MELNSKGKLARFYMWMPPDDKKLPQDLCTFFWGLLGRALFLLIFCGGTLSFCIYLIVLVTLWMWGNKGAASIILGGVISVVLAVWLTGRIQSARFEVLEEMKTVARGKVNGIKGRYCPRIDWK